MAATRYYIEMFNSLSNEVEWLVEFIDTEASPGVQSIRMDAATGSLTIDQAGGSNELIAGVYPTKCVVTAYVKVFHEAFVLDIAESTEKRWVVRVSRDGEIMFVGYLLPDEFTFSDDYYPYSLTVSAADFQFLQNYKYLDGIGNIEYYTISQSAQDTSAYTETPLSAGLPAGVGWTLYSHRATIYGLNDEYNDYLYGSDATTTYARWKMNSVFEPPGAGWISLGNSAWARPTTSLGIIDTGTTTNPDTGTEVYYWLDAFEQVGEREMILDIFTRGFALLDLQDYMNAAYFETLCDTYCDGMGDMTGNPFAQIRLPGRDLFATSNWNDILDKIAQTHGLRIYQANGTFRVEQITALIDGGVNYFQYDFEGNLIGTVAIEAPYVTQTSAAGIKTGGTYRYQAPLRDFVIKLELDEDNYLGQSYWDSNDMGTKYIGVVPNSNTPEAIIMNLRCRSISKFDFSTVSGLNASQRYNATRHIVVFTIAITAINRDTGISYQFVPSGVTIGSGGFEDPTGSSGTWVAGPTDPVEYQIRRELRHGSFPSGYGQANPYILDLYASLKLPVPGVNGEQFDFHVSWQFAAFFHEDALPSALQTPGNHEFFGQSFENNMYIIDGLGEKMNKGVSRLYTGLNTLENSKTNSIDAEWADLPYHKRGVEILNASGKWAKTSGGWGRGSGPFDYELLYLLANDAISLRMRPMIMFSGTIYSHDLDMGRLVQRNSIIYAMVKMAVRPDDDAWTVDLVEVSSTTPSGTGVVENPIAGGPIGGPIPTDPGVGAPGGNGGQDPDDVPLAFETNEVINSSDVKTTIQIVNTLEVFAASGTAIKIQNPSTGVFEWLTLTADLDPLDTSISIVSHIFIGSYPDGSYLIISAIEPPGPTNALLSSFKYNNENWSGNKLVINKLDWGYVSGLDIYAVANKFTVRRNGVNCLVLPAEPNWPTPTVNSPYYVLLDPDGKKLTWEQTPPCIPFDEEWIFVDIDLKR